MTVGTVEQFDCSVCKKHIAYHRDGQDCGTGYAIDGDTSLKVCYDCCAEKDKEFMREHGKISLYLIVDDKGFGKVCNWPSSLEIVPTRIKTGRHNIAGVRYDCWFVFEGFYWHCVRYGNMTEICHCRKTKQKAS
jgi:hypothetical protein